MVFRNNRPIYKNFLCRESKASSGKVAGKFRTCYNFIQQHQALGGTPAQKAGINESNLWKDLLNKAIHCEV